MIMRHSLMSTLLFTSTLLLTSTLLPANAAEDSEDSTFTGRLTGFQQAAPILSNGTGTFSAKLNASSLTFTLKYSNLSGPAIAAHIHFAQPGVNGGVVVNFCGEGGKPACPAGTSATLTGTVTGADVIKDQEFPKDQGVTAGSFADLVRILRSGDGYVNVHTTKFDGEIRAQI